MKGKQYDLQVGPYADGKITKNWSYNNRVEGHIIDGMSAWKSCVKGLRRWRDANATYKNWIAIKRSKKIKSGLSICCIILILL